MTTDAPPLTEAIARLMYAASPAREMTGHLLVSCMETKLSCIFPVASLERDAAEDKLEHTLGLFVHAHDHGVAGLRSVRCATHGTEGEPA